MELLRDECKDALVVHHLLPRVIYSGYTPIFVLSMIC